MKKSYSVLFLSLLLSLCIILCSCGANSPTETEAPSITNPHESSASFKVAFLQYDNDYCSAQMRQAFIARMRTLGYDEAKMKFDILNAQGNAETLEKNVQSLSGSDYSLIVAAGTLTAKAVAKSGTALPCVFIGAQDPVGNGLTAELNSPDKNMTGTAFRSSMDTLVAIMGVYTPQVKNLALLSFENNEFSKTDTASLSSTLTEGAYGVTVCELTSADDIGAKISELCQSVDAFYLPADDGFEKSFADIIRIATENGKPVFSTSESAISGGALLGSFASAEALAKNAALIADKVMQGEDISKIPVDVEIPASLFVNRQTANGFAVEIPKSDNLVVI